MAIVVRRIRPSVTGRRDPAPGRLHPRHPHVVKISPSTSGYGSQDC